MSNAEPVVEAVIAASVERSAAGDALCFTGALLRADAACLWKQAAGLLHGVRRFDLTQVNRVDSAGVALLAEWAARCGGVDIDGSPPGLAELRAAYRLTPALGFGKA